MLTTFHIKNFRSCKDVSSDGIGNILALAGRNGAGKTNILEGVDWLSKVSTTAPVQFGVHVFVFNETIEGEVCFNTGANAAYRYRAAVRVPQPRNVEDLRPEINEELHRIDTDQQVFQRSGEQVWIGGSKEIRVGFQSPAMPALLSFLPADAKVRGDLLDAFVFLSEIRYYPLDELSHPASPAVIEPSGYANWLAAYKANPAASNSVPMRLLHLHLTAPDVLDELKEIVGDNDLSLISSIMIDDIEFGKGRKSNEPARGEMEKYYFLRFVPSKSRSVVDYNGLSLGTRRVLQIVASALSDQSAVMLLEQPEDSIHSGLIKKVIEFLRRYSPRTQIIMATHAANVLNKMKPEEIRVVHLADGQTKLRGLTQQELAAASRYVQHEGPLSEFVEVTVDEINN